MASERSPELAALDVFVGRWNVAVPFPDAPPGQLEFSWALEGRYLLQQSAVPDSPVPSTMCLIDVDDKGYLQHYFDSRGVTRLYRMTLEGGVWTLSRTEADFSPLNFAQRYVGTFSADGATIEGRWEQSHDLGATWEVDFPITYTRVP